MLLERIYTPGLAQVSYLVGDSAAGVAAVIDPRRDVGVYLDLSARHRVTLIAAIETHVHADFVSGAIELAAATGATIYAARLGESEFDHTPLDDGDVIEVGRVRLRAFHTPGHTPEHLSFLLYEGDDGPLGLFSGDSLFVGEVGRPDLLGEDQTDRLLEQLYETVFQRLSPLPDGLTVYPGHGAGSSCGRSIGSEPTTTIGQERIGNYAFRPRELDDFKKAIMEDMPPAPTYYPILKRLNKDGAPLLSTLSSGAALSPDDIAQAIEGGEPVVDAREPLDFAAGHISGTLSIGAGSSFVTWIGWLAPYDDPLRLILPSDEMFQEIQIELRRIGVDNVGGYLRGGIDAWVRCGRDVESYPVLNVDELNEALGENGDDMQVVDVRSLSEWRLGHIDGAHHQYLGEMFQSENGLPDGRPLAFICATGYRSNVAASLARRRGYRSVVNVDGGMDGWAAAGHPMTWR
jgi:hydroxyacylglutathione hydrolase